MPSGLTKNQKEAMFRILGYMDSHDAKPNDKRVHIKYVAYMMRSIGQNPTPAEIAEVKKQMDPEGKGDFNIDELVTYLDERTMVKQKQELVEELVTAFHLFDRNQNGKVSLAEMKAALVKCGDDPLSQSEAEELFHLLQGKQDELDEKEFLKMAEMLCFDANEEGPAIPLAM